MLLRTLKAVGVTPRKVMLMGMLVPFLGRVVMTTTSQEASGLPSAPRATRGSTAMRLAWPMSIHEVSSDMEPRWVTMALLSEPVELKRDVEAAGHGQNGHKGRHHQSNAEDGQQRDLPARAQIANVIAERKRHQRTSVNEQLAVSN